MHIGAYRVLASARGKRNGADMDESESQSSYSSFASSARRGGLFFAAGALLSVMSLWFFGIDTVLGKRLLFSNDMQYSDFWHLHYPLKHFYAEALAEGRLAQWCHLLGSGVPLHAVGEAGMLYPPNLVLFSLLPLPVATNLSIIGHFVLAGVLATGLASQLGASRSGALLAGLSFAFSAFFVVHARHMNLSAVAAWAPGIFLFMERYWRNRRPIDLCVLAVIGGMSLLAGHPNLAYNHALIAAGYGLYLTLRRPAPSGSPQHVQRTSSLQFVLAMGLAVLLALLLAAPQLLPSLQLHRQGPRMGGLSFDYSSQFDLHPSYLRTWLQPHAFGRPDRFTSDPKSPLGSGFRGVPGQTNLYWEVVPYLGLVPLLLAILAVVRGARRRTVQALVLMALLSMTLAMGRHVGIGELLHTLLPGYDLFRFHPRFQLYAVLAVAVLGGLGLSELERVLKARSRNLSRVLAALVLGLAAVDLEYHLGSHNSFIDSKSWTTQPASLLGLAEGGDAPRSRVLSFDPEQRVFLRGYLRGGGWSGVEGGYEPARQLARDNYNVLFDVPQAEFYLPLYPQRARAVTESLYRTNSKTNRTDRIHSGLAALFNVATVFASEREPIEGLVPGPMFPGDDRPAIERIVRYSLPDALPRAFLVPKARVVTGAGYEAEFLPAEQMEALLAITASDFDPLDELVIDRRSGEEAPPIGVATADSLGSVQFLSYQAERIRLEVIAAEPAWLFLSDTWYPGWRSYVDGQRTSVFPANVAGRAVFVPAGTHEVEFVFRSDSLRLGTLLALLGLLILSMIAVRLRSTDLD